MGAGAAGASTAHTVLNALTTAMTKEERIDSIALAVLHEFLPRFRTLDKRSVPKLVREVTTLAYEIADGMMEARKKFSVAENPLLDLPIRDLPGIGVRARRALQNKFSSIRELVNATPSEMGFIKNFGMTSTRETRAALYEQGFTTLW